MMGPRILFETYLGIVGIEGRRGWLHGEVCVVIIIEEMPCLLGSGETRRYVHAGKCTHASTDIKCSTMQYIVEQIWAPEREFVRHSEKD